MAAAFERGLKAIEELDSAEAALREIISSMQGEPADEGTVRSIVASVSFARACSRVSTMRPVHSTMC